MTTGRPSAASGVTKARILDAATTAFLVHGYRATSLRDIAAGADMTHQGLRRHFPDKAALLASVLRRYDEAADDEAASDDTLDIATFVGGIVHANEAKPGWTALFAGVSGEATAPGHPLHAAMRGRYATHRRSMARILKQSQERTAMSTSRDTADTAVRLTAIWDGLQLLHVHLGADVDIAAGMALETALLRDPPPPVSAWARAGTPTPVHAAAPPASGFGAGRARRNDILDAAISLFTQHGLHDTSIADIARDVGVTKAALFHHYPTKDDLALAVLRFSDGELEAASTHASRQRGVARIQAEPTRAQGLVVHAPRLIRLHATLCAEATAPRHPLHDEYRGRLTDHIATMQTAYAEAIDAGAVRTDLSPAALALRHVALWEGLHVQWCFAPAEINFARHLREHIDEVIVTE